MLKLFLGICVFRSGPESVPTQVWFLVALVAANLAFAVFLYGAIAPMLAAALALNVALIGVTTTAALTWFILYLRRLESRFPATFGAMLGTQLIIAGAMWIGIHLVGAEARAGATVVFIVWAVVVAGFILHRALSCRLWLGILLAFGIRSVGEIIATAALGTAISESIGLPLE